MSRTSSTHPSIKFDDNDVESKEEEDDDGFLKFRKAIRNTIDDDDDDSNARVRCITLYSHRRHSHKKGPSGRQEGQEQKNKAATIRRQLKAGWALEDLIDKQFKHYNQGVVPTKIEDVSQLLAPLWTPPLEMVAVGWLGDWRPSAILDLLRSLARSSYFSSSTADSAEIGRILSQLIREIRIEEAIIDEEMVEIQATCILHLPFKQSNQARSSSIGPWDCVLSQLKKIKQVITKSQQLRNKVLELVMKKVLNQVDAAEFLIAFAGIQDVIHQFAARKKLKKGPVYISTKALATV
ncbi:uncharacterized protein LOC110698903 [Chenopodium quinoa]|uniref:DOG1 domain-containing protein n=1 Tax=Chenopodium quinoa TaxID=63459 RepID=A0A803LES2_CHEQI|nr:uncharacterized protein LOC110698903 [Chenopodium quinoa]